MNSMENNSYFILNQKYFEKKAAKKTGNSIGFGFLVFIGVYLLSQIAAAALIMAGVIPYTLLDDSVFNTIYSSVISLLSFLGGGAVILAAQRQKIYNAISYQKPQNRDDYTLIIIGVGVCFAASYIMGVIIALLKDTALEPKMHDMSAPQDPAGLIAYMLMVSVIPAFCEEFLFRGAILQSLRKFGDMTALFVSTVFFALIHGNLVQIPFTLAAGFVMGYAALKTGSLVIPVAIHFCNNFLATLFDYLLQQAGGFAEIFITFFELAIVVAAIVLAVRYIKKHGFLNFAPQRQITGAAVIRAKIIFAPAVIPFWVYVVISIITEQLTA